MLTSLIFRFWLLLLWFQWIFFQEKEQYHPSKSTCQALKLCFRGDGFTTMTSFLSEPICFVLKFEKEAAHIADRHHGRSFEKVKVG